jgi:hypothetical protein
MAKQSDTARMADGGQPLNPLPYHYALLDYFKSQERELWEWFASAQAKSNYTESLRLELLKSTYRLDTENHPDLYRLADEVKERLGLAVPVTIYQSQAGGGPNAALYFLPGEGHVVLSGSLISLLNGEEMKSILGHELAHYVLWTLKEGDFFILDRLIQAIACDPRADPPHAQSARWFRLYTEIYADRGALVATDNVETVVSGLVKTLTGLQHVSAGSYLKQAEEIFARSRVQTTENSHPEAFIRARALSLWAGHVPDAAKKIAAMIEGDTSLDDLDLLGQMRLTQLTRRFLAELLRPKWFQTKPVLAHARMFFADFAPARELDAALAEELKFSDTKLQEYLCFLMLDFVVADPELEELPLAASLKMAESMNLGSMFEKIVAKELKIRSKDLGKVKAKSAELLERAEKSA